MTIREIALAMLFAFDLVFALGIAAFLLFANGGQNPREMRRHVSTIAGLLAFFALANILFYAGLWLLIR